MSDKDILQNPFEIIAFTESFARAVFSEATSASSGTEM